MVRLKGNLFAPVFPTSEEQMFRVSTLTFPFAYSFTLPVSNFTQCQIGQMSQATLYLRINPIICF